MEDLRKVCFNAGAKGEHTAFLFTDSQIVQEEFLEDVNNILNSGNLPLPPPPSPFSPHQKLNCCLSFFL